MASNICRIYLLKTYISEQVLKKACPNNVRDPLPQPPPPPQSVRPRCLRHLAHPPRSIPLVQVHFIPTIFVKVVHRWGVAALPSRG